eukprot:NODE_2683_length_1142_cov_64.963403_g2461_i0.p1 GENE.NODE_2683_length_1142_cov_64.963403_g2461_i0~~NODE_2683_length_1142_cov_64.963403_g2461_i0.p1  ORF type:complete len:333 (+),score=37.51 NODE_2683_length_1142_cov_64.963403_g2461_i0:58-999(+)
MKALGYGDPEFPPPPPTALGALITSTGHLRRGFVKKYISTWKWLTWMQQYPIIVFADRSTEAERQWVVDEMAGFRVLFYAQQANLNSGVMHGLYHQRGLLNGAHRYKWERYVGYLWANQFLGIEMYKHPALARLTYIMRFDDDIIVTKPSALDIFKDMQLRGIRVGWTQGFVAKATSGASGISRATARFACSPQRTAPLSDAWNRSRPRWTVTAGCVEVYHVGVFMTQHYIDFLRGMYIWEMLSSFWHEQDWKSVWELVYVPSREWKFYGCNIRTYHKDVKTTFRQPWFRKCDKHNSSALPLGNDVEPHPACG